MAYQVAFGLNRFGSARSLSSNIGSICVAMMCFGSIYFATENHSRMRRIGGSIASLKTATEKFDQLYENRVRRASSYLKENNPSSVVKRAADQQEPLKVEAEYFLLDGGGASYIHWGRSDCRGDTLTNLVYSGIAAGTHYSHAGGGSNYICLYGNITYEPGKYVEGGQGSSHIYGVEFRDSGWMYPLFDLSDTENNALHLHSLPCAMCLSQAMVTQIMIPDREVCPEGWNLEYRGYLMGGGHGDTHASKFICVDEKPQVVPGTNKNDKGSFLYMVEPQCASLLCEPFVVNRELRCVVCSF